MAEPSGRDLLGEWRGLMDSVIDSMSAATGRAPLPRELLGAMQRQFELAHDLIERERRTQRDLAARLTAPVDAAFDLLEATAGTLRRQAEALEAAGRALEETARLMKRQAELFERTVGTLRQPADLAKALAGLERRPPKTGSGGLSTRAAQRHAKGMGRPRATTSGQRKAEGAGRRTAATSSQRKATGASQRKAATSNQRKAATSSSRRAKGAGQRPPKPR